MTANQIRQTFLDFFASKGHKIVPSSPMVVKNDPTLMFTNAGMNPFKDIFLGNNVATNKRVADTQKCLRVSGKHNDLEEVGVDTYHHTMFEMLGNWSFGDYFKQEAITWAWELLTEVYKLPKDRLYVTIFEGDASENLEKDIESATIWEKFIAKDRILLGNKKDNFWEMGEVGPCGPCTEIHFDSRPDEERSKVDGSSLVNADDPLVIEIWNNVFMEFNRKADKSLEKLPAQHVDTGMGFERLVRVIQDKTSNYDTDIFMPLIEKVCDLSGKEYNRSDSQIDISIRVIVDHIRAISCSIADGQIPSNTGAGYVIRRILRRAIRYGYTNLEFETPFMFRLVEVLAHQMQDVFPEIKAQQSYIENVIKEEENSFFRTLSVGVKLFSDKMKDEKSKIIFGKDVFELYDTYGFPVDLTRLMAREKGWDIDEEGFLEELEIQKNRSRNATKLETEDWVEVHQNPSHSIFVGYDRGSETVKVLRYRVVKSKQGSHYQLVLDQTPFYAESGGQVGDTGFLKSANGIIAINNTVKENDTIMHISQHILEDMSVSFEAQIDSQRRSMIAKNHTATHLLQAALRSVLGDHVQQKGSLVNENQLRFDFAHFAKLTENEIEEVETIVNGKIAEQIKGNIENNVPIESAKERGVTALFGEKYGEFVRVVTFDQNYSMELCGGTHVSNTSEVGFFKILTEASIASGIRRIEATTSQTVIKYYQAKEKQLKDISNVLKNPTNPILAIQSIQNENIQLKKEAKSYEVFIVNTELNRIRTKILAESKQMVIEEISFSSDIAKSIASALRTDFPDKCFQIMVRDEKLRIHIACGDAYLQNGGKDAKTIVQELSSKIQGSGGGQPSIASFVGDRNGQVTS
jgi:alanyl-tRNA synthetase